MTPERMFKRSEKQRLMKAVGSRISCRSFQNTVTLQEWAECAYLAQRCSMPGARLVLMRCDDGVFIAPTQGNERITGCSQMAVLICDRSVQNSIIHAGFVGEAFMLQLTDRGYGTCWIGESYRRHVLNVTMTANEVVCAVIVFGHPRGSIFHFSAERKLKALENLSTTDVSQWAPDLRAVAEAVRLAPSNHGLQPWKLMSDGFRSITLMTGAGNDGEKLLELGIIQCHAELAAGFPHIWHEPDLASHAVCMERKVRA